MGTTFKTLKEYFYPEEGKKTFVIPCYQRSYKWSVKIGKEQTSVEYLINNLLTAYNSNSEQQFFLQGVTVVEDGDDIILIDGQQRTTTLYLILWCLGKENISGSCNIDIDYRVGKQYENNYDHSFRCESKSFLQNLKDDNFNYQKVDPENKKQDIYYFKEAINQIKKCLPENDFDKKSFIEFLFNKVSLLYIVIDADKAVRTFTMMNGQKAIMHNEELIKAEMLHCISLPEKLTQFPSIRTFDETFDIIKELLSMEWETNALRSKYAREWDKWLYWWNREDVCKFFNTNKPMGLLLEYYLSNKLVNKKVSFRNFKEILPDNNKRKAKEIFKELRDLQKSFEDLFNNPISFNCLKCAFISSSGENQDKFKIISYFIKNKKNIHNLKNYSKWRLIGATHIEIVEQLTKDPDDENVIINNEIKCKERALQVIENLSQAKVYNVYDEILLKQLLRLNVNEYNKLENGKGVKFDFSIWSNKSLEHISPKSKYYHNENTKDNCEIYVRGDGRIISPDDVSKLIDSDTAFGDKSRYSEHCVGNLVLLYGRNNSEFGALDFEIKKQKFFSNERSFESRNLLHTISKFAKSEWGIEQIKESADEFISILKNDYNLNDNESKQ